MFIRSRNSLFAGIIWSILFFAFVLIFHLFEWNTGTKLISSAILLVSFIVQFIVIAKNKGEIQDERTAKIQLKSTSISFVVTLIYVFLVTIVLYEANQDVGTVGIPWLWFIAYSTVLFTFSVNGILYFIIDAKGINYED